MRKNQNGFSVIEGLLILVIVAVIGGVGYFVYNSQQETKKSQDNSNKSSQEITAAKDSESDDAEEQLSPEDQAKIKYIKDYNTATASLKQALLGTIYDEAKKTCDDAKAEVPNMDTSTYIIVKKVVRDDFALIAYCGSGSDKILAKVDGNWARVSGIGMGHAGCEDVDKYKISKEISAKCLLSSGATRDVTYP